MRALVCHAYGPIDSLKVEDIASPEPKAGEVLVKVRAAGVSFAAMLGVQGKHQNKPPLPYVPGNELAGHVVALGEGVTNVAVGDRVATGVSQGAFAEYATAAAANLIPIPEIMPYAEATNFPTLYPTAYGALKWKADMKPGEVLLVHGAGGGSGYSPCKMMNEWGLPTVPLQGVVCGIASRLTREGLELPSLVIAGGFATEDQVFKALALGAPHFQAVGLCRAAMAAANSAKKVGELIEAGTIPAHLKKFGDSREALFADLPDLRHLYGKEADSFSAGAIGVFSYLNRIALGLRHFAALNRKFDVNLLGPDDLIPLTREAGELR